MCMSCGCGMKDGSWKGTMQPMVFKDGQMKTGPVNIQPAKSQGASSGARLSDGEKYRQLKAQTEAAGMSVREKNRKIVVSRKKNGGK